MHRKYWKSAACAVMVMGLAGCQSLSAVSGKLSQGWERIWEGGDKPTSAGKASPAGRPSSVAQPAAGPASAAPAAPGLKPSAQTQRWQGLYSLEAGQGRFQECTTGQLVQVLAEKDHVLLEQAYLNTRSHEAAVMLAEVQGRMVEQPSSDPVRAQQGVKVLALRVEQWLSLSSLSHCPEIKK